MAFSVLPAIDLSGGEVVRLVQGEPDRRIDYDVSPASAAQRFHEAGADWLHVVDLDGAFKRADDANQAALASILATGAHVQLGGGLRALEDIEHVLNLGVGRVVVGTMAAERPEELARTLTRFGPERVLVAIDARAGRLQSHGWTRDEAPPLHEFAEGLAARGVERVIYTSADRDGTGRGLDLATAREIQDKAGVATIVSGGVGELADVRRAQERGLAGVIIGRALHDGRISLEEALRC